MKLGYSIWSPLETRTFMKMLTVLVLLCDEKARFTTLEMGLSNGKMAPLFHIIKCASKIEHNLSSPCIIQNLHQLPRFCAEDSWDLNFWERTMKLQKAKKKGIETQSFITPLSAFPTSSIWQSLQYCSDMPKITWMDTAGSLRATVLSWTSPGSLGQLLPS